MTKKTQTAQEPKAGFYQEPMMLNSEAHKDLKFTPLTDYSHAKNVGSALLLGHEFMMVAKEYPIVFVKDAEDNWDSVVLLSLKTDSNLYVGKKGEWLGHYVPAVYRRYPFILSTGAEQTDFTVCFDNKSKCFSTKKGEALFTEKGEKTTTLENIIKFLNDFQLNLEVTKQFMAKMVELDLLKSIEGTFTMKDGEKFTMRGMWVIDEEKLASLDEKTVAVLFKSGMLAWMQFHVMSLSNLVPLADKFAETQQGIKAA
ncbi:MAG: hypothetical protein ACI9TY_001359 [Alphaproteobacteria bacterium]|jgi:hypothetical protein